MEDISVYEVDVDLDWVNVGSTANSTTNSDSEDIKDEITADEESEEPFLDDNPMEDADSDNVKECTFIDMFWENHANCPLKCTQEFTKEQIIRLRNESESLDEWVDGCNKLNVTLLSIIRVILSHKYVQPNRTRNLGGRQKDRCSFMLHGVRVCKSLFLFAHNIGKTRWAELVKIYKTEGLVEKRHGLCAKRPAHAISTGRSSFVVEFLKNYADQYAAVFILGHQANHRNFAKVLPLGETKHTVFKKYEKACHNNNVEPVSGVSFNKIWRECCPSIVIQKNGSITNRYS